MHGLVAASVSIPLSFAVILLIQGLSIRLYPIPASVDANDKEQLRRFIRQLPAGAYLLVALSYMAGSFAAGLAVGRLAQSNKTAWASVVGAVLTGLGVMNMMTVPQPLWFGGLVLVTFLPMVLVGAWCGAKWGRG